jgi:hypothetical protein
MQRHTMYYNKRPAEEKKGAEAMERSASLLSLGALGERRGRGLGRAEHGRGGERWDGQSGRVLTTSKCMAPKARCLHHCRFPSDRPTRETRWWNGAQWEEGGRVAQK